MVIAVILLFPVVLTGILILWRATRYPEKSLYNSFLNVILTPLRLMKLGPFKQGRISIDKAMKYAMKKTKLTDFGNPNFAESYSLILDTPTHKSMKFSNLGYIMNRLELNLSMIRRLKMLQYLKEMPEILNIPVRSPVFVFGLPRTGTTFLHRLLSLDPSVRAPLLWELLAPTPDLKAPSSDSGFVGDREKRAKIVRKLIKDRKSMGDSALEHIHEVDADLPEECIMALSDEIPCHLSYFYTVFSNHEVFFDKIDFPKVVKAYEHYKKVLQLLSFQIGQQKDPKRWMLKCPIHLFYTKELATVFPDAKLIWTHRHPISAIPSLCSLVKAVTQTYYENECRDDAVIGKSLYNLYGKTLNQTPKDIKDTKLDCSHVIYNDLIADPIKVVKSIYAQNKWEFTKEYEGILTDYISKNRKKREEVKAKKGKKEQLHFYSPEEYSLTSEQLSEGNFKEYINAFNLPLSKN